MSKKQEINRKRRQLCQAIINDNIPPSWGLATVRAAFMNGSLPHGIALAWTGPKDAYLVNFKNKTAKEYVRDGKFLLKRALLPIRVWVSFPKDSVEARMTQAVHDGLLRAVAENECPGCVNQGWGMEHNGFCSLRGLREKYSGEVDTYFD